MSRHRPSRRIVALSSLLILALAGCSSSKSSGGGGSPSGSSGAGTTSTSAAAAAKTVSLTVSHTGTGPDNFVLQYAQDEGFFAAQHLKVDIKLIAGTVGLTELINGKTQFAQIGGGNVVAAAVSGADVKWLADIDAFAPFKFYVRPNITSAADLKGKKIGTTDASGSLTLCANEAIKRLGLSPGDVSIVSLGSVPNAEAALDSGAVQGLCAHPPDSSKLESAGMKVLLDLSTAHIQDSVSGITTTGSYIKSHSDIVQRFMNGLTNAVVDIKKNEAKVLPLMNKFMGGDLTSSVLDATYKFYFSSVIPSDFTPNTQQLSNSRDQLVKTVPKAADFDLASILAPEFATNAAKAAGTASN